MANTNTFTLSSWMSTGNMLRTIEYDADKHGTVAKLLETEGVSPQNSIVDIVDKDGNAKSSGLTDTVSADDVVTIQKKSNKSG